MTIAGSKWILYLVTAFTTNLMVFIKTNIVVSGLAQVAYIKVNNTNIPFSGGTAWNIPATATYANTYLDVIEIKVVNFEEIDDFNVGAMIASVSFVNEGGGVEYLESNSNWYCNGESASIVAHPFLRDFSGIAGITSGSKWIWSNPTTQLEVVCTAQIRARVRNPRIDAYAMCDDQVMSIWAGSAFIASGGDCWTCTIYGSVNYYIKSGDVLVLEGRDLHGGGMDIQGRFIIYENEWFEYEEIYSYYDWTCNSGPAGGAGRSGSVYGATSIWNQYGNSYSYCTKKYDKPSKTKYADDCS